MRTTHRAAAILLLAFALAGCAQPAGSSSTAGAGHAGDSAGLGAIDASTPPPAAPGGGGSGPAGAPPAPSYPSDAGVYSRAAVTAWLAGDNARLDQLRDPANMLFHSIGLGDYDRHYTFQWCQGAAGSSYCMFYNAVGDELRLHLLNPRLGGPHAIIDGEFHPLTFPPDMQAYAQECLDGWKAGNTTRVGYLTTADALAHLNAIATGHRSDDWTFQDAQGAAGSSYLTWRNGSGDRIVFRFHNPGVVPGEGPQHRIVDVLWNP